MKLRRLHKQATLEALRDALNDTDWSVRAAAVHSLALRKDPRLRTDLARLSESDAAAAVVNIQK